MSERDAGKKKITVEELKQQKDGLDIWQDVEQWAKTGYESIPDEMFDLLKWYGIYRQKPNDGHFMIRIRIPGGRMNTEQARTIAQISREFGRDTLDITVRQNYQIHWLTIDVMPEVQRRLHAVGLGTTMACGDVPRNIVSCPMAGRDCDELIDAYPVVSEVNDAIIGNREFSNLPRKFKMSISGCSIHCALPEINDIGLYGAIRKKANGEEERGFNLIAGGGLSTRPFFGKVMNAFVPAHQAKDVCVAITKIFRDLGNRKSRNKARMKFLVQQMGAEAFRAEIIKYLGYDLDPAAETNWNLNAFRDHIGIRKQKQDDLHSLGMISVSGRIKPEDLFIAADIAEQCGSGTLANTNMQNLLVMDVPEGKLDQAQSMLNEAPTLTLEEKPIRSGLVVCTGIEFCNLAVTETKHRSKEILEYLENEVQLDTPVKISISGCPNSCSQYQSADIGLRGGKTRIDGEQAEAYDIFVGAKMGDGEEFGTQVRRAVPTDQAGKEIASILNGYLTKRNQGENFQQYTHRMLADKQPV